MRLLRMLGRRKVAKVPLRVAFVTESRSVWGAEESLLLMLSEFPNSVINPTVIVETGSPLVTRLRQIDCNYIEHDFAAHPALEKFGGFANAPFLTQLKELFNIARFSWSLAAVLKDFEVVVAFSLWQSFETRLAAMFRGVVFVLDLHETFGGRLGHNIIGLLGRGSSLVLAPSSVVLLENHLMGRRNAHILPRPVKEAKNRAVPMRSKFPLTVGIFGQIVPHKGVHHLVDAVGRTPHPIRLIVVGGEADSYRREEYEARIREDVAKLGSSSIVLDRVSDPYDLMSACHYVFNVSEHEAFGRTVAEAVRAGSHPVALEGTGAAEVVRLAGFGSVLNGPTAIAAFLDDAWENSGEDTAPDPAKVLAAAEIFSPKRIGRAYCEFLVKVFER